MKLPEKWQKVVEQNSIKFLLKNVSFISYLKTLMANPIKSIFFISVISEIETHLIVNVMMHFKQQFFPFLVVYKIRMHLQCNEILQCFHCLSALKYFIISLLIFLAQCILVICYFISRCEVFSYSFIAYIQFYYVKTRKYSLCIPRNVSVLLSVFSLSVSLYLRVSPVDTQKHVCLFVLLPPGHSASATVKSLGWEGHTGVGTDPAPPHLCCDLYPLLLRAVGAHSAHHETPAGLV